MNSLALKDVDNEVLNEADEYLRKHKILELFEVSTLFPSNTLLSLKISCFNTYFASIGLDHSSGLQAAR